MISVVVVDDLKSVREYLSSYLSENPNISVVGTATNGEEAITVVKNTVPDIVLMDIEMPLMNGIEATKVISRLFDRTKILLLTVQDNQNLVDLAMNVGARGYLLKSARSLDLVKIIQLTAQGYFQFGPFPESESNPKSIAKIPTNTKNNLKYYELIDKKISKKVLEIAKQITATCESLELQQNQIYKFINFSRKHQQPNFINSFSSKVSDLLLDFDYEFTNVSTNYKILIWGFILGAITPSLAIAMLHIIKIFAN